MVLKMNVIFKMVAKIKKMLNYSDIKGVVLII